MLAQAGGQSDVLVLAWAWAWDAWETVACNIDAPRNALELYEGWATEAEVLGEELVRLSHPGVAALRRLSRVGNRANHLWTA